MHRRKEARAFGDSADRNRAQVAAQCPCTSPAPGTRLYLVDLDKTPGVFKTQVNEHILHQSCIGGQASQLAPLVESVHDFSVTRQVVDFRRPSTAPPPSSLSVEVVEGPLLLLELEGVQLTIAGSIVGLGELDMRYKFLYAPSCP